MPSWRARLVSFLLRHTFKPALAHARSAMQARRVLNSGVFKTPSSVRISPVTLGGVPGERVAAPGVLQSGLLLYFHGGGYFACSARTHRPFTTYFARRGFTVYAPNYRLAPEHPFPAAVLDAAAAYRALRAEAGESVPIAIAGDSAGGGLALAVMLKLRDDGDPLPLAAALFSPLTDLTGSGGSRANNDAHCAMFRSAEFARLNDFYLRGHDPRDPLASPLFGDLAGLPPLLIHVGAEETLLDDSRRFAERARAAGVPVELTVWPAVSHVWQLFYPVIPEGRKSLDRAAAFLKAPAAVDVAIIGSGFGGLCTAIRLRRAGQNSFVMLERAGDIGGTWRDNTYPGCTCDIPSHLYSFSFELSPNWTRMYPSQGEIWEYMKHCVEKYDLGSSIRFGREVCEAIFDESADLWRLRTVQGDTITARAVVSATGPLSRPAYPNIPGLERFEGPSFHSAEWDHGYNLRGKRVAVIGTGASSIQFVPEIAPIVARLYVFQRTPPWIIPKLDRSIRAWEHVLFRHVPGAMRLFRKLLYCVQELVALGYTVNVNYVKPVEKLARFHIRHSIPDSALRRKVTPDYLPGCKRLLMSNDYYAALTRPNVELVTEPIAEVREGSVVTAGGEERAVDAIICGTGFRATDVLAPMRFIGRKGVDLNDVWREGLEAYYGVTVNGFPNLFFLLGPNSGLGHNSVVFMIEAQVNHVMACLKLMRERGATAIEVRPEVQARFNHKLQERMKRTVWASGCKSWYQNSKGRNTTLWPWFSWRFWIQTRRGTDRQYDLSIAHPETGACRKPAPVEQITGFGLSRD